jgi:hypothetical protein
MARRRGRLSLKRNSLFCARRSRCSSSDSRECRRSLTSIPQARQRRNILRGLPANAPRRRAALAAPLCDASPCDSFACGARPIGTAGTACDTTEDRQLSAFAQGGDRRDPVPPRLRRVERALDVPPSGCRRRSQHGFCRPDCVGHVRSGGFATSESACAARHEWRRRAGYIHNLRSPWQVLVLLPLLLLLLFLHLLLLALFLVFLTTLVSHRSAPCSPLWLVAASLVRVSTRVGRGDFQACSFQPFESLMNGQTRPSSRARR